MNHEHVTHKIAYGTGFSDTDTPIQQRVHAYKEQSHALTALKTQGVFTSHYSNYWTAYSAYQMTRPEYTGLVEYIQGKRRPDMPIGI